jgi:hypothetical protein
MQTIRIQQFNAQYNVARNAIAPDSSMTLQRRLDRVATDLLPRALDDQIVNSTDNNEPICFIQQMEVNLTLDPTHLDDRQLAAIWADALYKGILQALSHPDNSVLIFQTRGEFLASFLEDLLWGRAWDYWYYEEFDSLRPKSLNQVALSVLLEDGDTGRDALQEVTRRGSLERLLAILSDREVEIVADRCLVPPSPRVILPNTLPVWIENLRSLFRSGLTLTFTLSRDMMRLYLNLLRQHPELGPDVNLARFLRDVLQLRQTIVAMNDRSAFLSYLESDNWTARESDNWTARESDNWTARLNQLGRGNGQQLLMSLMRELTGGEVVALLRDLQVETPQPISQRVVTPYGGIFLLVGAIADLELDRFLQHSPYPEPEGISKMRILLWAIALQCLGYENAIQAKRDRGLAVFAGLSKVPELTQLQHYVEMFAPAIHTAFIQQFQIHLREQLSRPEQFGLARSLSSTSTVSLDWFCLCPDSNPLLPDAQWDAALAGVSSTVLQAFAAKLGAFSDSSPSYLCRNFLESQAAIEVSENAIVVRFLTCPLQMVLRMAGFESSTWEIPWLENRQLSFQFD